jgi:tetratricopeptide (TPR) repeat protein
MICLPPQLMPAELLLNQGLPPFIVELLRESRSLCREGRLPDASRCAQDAMKASQKPGSKVIQAVALIHLADARRETGRLGPALGDCQSAYRIFQSQSSRYQRHNEAVAAYALGLVHQLLGSDMDALKWYQESDALFEKVKCDWVAVNAQARVETCTRTQRWMETLGEYLTSARARMDANIDTRVWIPIVLSGGEAPRFSMAELEVEKYVVGRQMVLDGELYHVRPLKGRGRISLDTDGDYYALKVPDKAHERLGASEGDYALVGRRQDADQEGPGVLETGSGREFGNFERGDAGLINFVRVDATVIGGEDLGDDLRVGYVAALLKPA